MPPRKAKEKKQPTVKKEESEEQKRLKELRKYAAEDRYLTEYSLEIFEDALEIDHKASSHLLKRFNQINVKILKVNSNYYSFTSNWRSIPDFLTLRIKQMNSDEFVFGEMESFVEGTGKLFFDCNNDLDTKILYSIEFEQNRSCINSCKRALKRINDYGLLNFVTSFEENIEVKKKRNIKPPSKWFNKKIPEDSVQKGAVLKILSESSYPFPMVITGGPGTGKTSVIVEAILQILDKKSFAHVLVTCQSNSACDEVAMRLRNFVTAVKVFRYWGPLMAKTKLKNKDKDYYFTKLCENSSIVDRSFNEPWKENLVNYKIVVATMTTADRLIRKGFPSDHFDFIFIDECCAAMEPESLIPIVGLGMSQKKMNANVVLVGDDQLLGPVLYSSLAASLGLEQSLLERIMRLEAYSPETSPRVVKLTNNYRSHPEIFKYSNETYYESSIETMVSSEVHNFAKGWKQLPNPDIPIIFHSVEAESVEVKEYDGVSRFNIEEIEQVFYYIEHLVTFGLLGKRVKQDQIGIASPYTSQVKKLRDRLKPNFPLVDVGTTEFFQGREKPVMIISAVRTSNTDTGFMDSERRLNVLLTRAKSLMIIIGNVKKLYSFFSWEPFIDHCLRNGLVRRGNLNDDGIIERIHTLHISKKDDENNQSSETESEEEWIIFDDGSPSHSVKEEVNSGEVLDWAEEVD